MTSYSKKKYNCFQDISHFVQCHINLENMNPCSLIHHDIHVLWEHESLQYVTPWYTCFTWYVISLIVICSFFTKYSFSFHISNIIIMIHYCITTIECFKSDKSLNSVNSVLIIFKRIIIIFFYLFDNVLIDTSLKKELWLPLGF